MIVPQQVKVGLSPRFDCENLRDFSQYYKGRYFGLNLPDYPGVIVPAAMLSIPSSERAFDVAYLVPEIHSLNIRTVSFKEIQTIGWWGSPTLGTFLWGPHYTYADTSAFRESMKGLGLSRANYFIPNFNDKILQVYYRKNPGEILATGNFGSPVEFKVAGGILNKRQYTYRGALEALERGDRIGCNISNKVGLSIAEGLDEIEVYYKTSVVGKIGRERRIVLHEPSKFLISAIEAQLPGVAIT